MEHYVYSLALIISAIAPLMYVYREVKAGDFSANTKADCSALLVKQATKGLKNGDECANWDGSQCRKGNYKNGYCISKGNPLILLFGILGVILIILGIIAALKKSPKTLSYSFF